MHSRPIAFRIVKFDVASMHDLEDMLAKLLEAARRLPPGTERHAILEQIGTFRVRLSAIAAKRQQSQSAR
jgi:hypothetical protein